MSQGRSYSALDLEQLHREKVLRELARLKPDLLERLSAALKRRAEADTAIAAIRDEAHQAVGGDGVREVFLSAGAALTPTDRARLEETARTVEALKQSA